MTRGLRTTGFWLGLTVTLGCGGRTDEQSPDDAARGSESAATLANPAASLGQAPSSPPPYATTSTAAPPLLIPTPPSVPASSVPPVVTQPLPPSPPPDPAPSEPARPNPAPAPSSDPCFAYLGDWITCENAGWPNAQKTDASDLPACMQACLQQRDCTAVTEYFWMDRPDLGCFLHTSTCNAPAAGPWQEEDGGRQYRRTCPSP